MRYRIYCNDGTRPPCVFTREAEGETLTALLSPGVVTTEEENSGFAFEDIARSLLRGGPCPEGEEVLLLDRSVYSENEHRFGYCREERLRLLRLRGGEWRYLTARNCEEDYEVRLLLSDARGTAGVPNPETVLEGLAGEWTEREDARLTAGDLLRLLED